MFYTIGHLEIPNTTIMEKPLLYFEGNNKDGINKIFKEIKNLTGYRYDNTHMKWSNRFGDMFAISIYASKYRGEYTDWNISVWDISGGISITSLSQKIEDLHTDILLKENYNLLCKETEKFTKGIINCTNCKKEMSKSDIGGRYFAGSYCMNCWEGKYKAIEAKENYN